MIVKQATLQIAFGEEVSGDGRSGRCTCPHGKPNPLLAITPTGSRMAVTWQGLLTGFRLQSAINLNTSNSWIDVGVTPTLVQGQNTVTNVTSGGNRFYRLIQ